MAYRHKPKPKAAVMFDKEKVLRQIRLDRSRDPEVRERTYAHRRKRYAEDEDFRKRIQQQTRDWIKNNPEKSKESTNRWRKKNPDKVKGYQKKYYEKMKGKKL